MHVRMLARVFRWEQYSGIVTFSDDDNNTTKSTISELGPMSLSLTFVYSLILCTYKLGVCKNFEEFFVCLFKRDIYYIRLLIIIHGIQWICFYTRQNISYMLWFGLVFHAAEHLQTRNFQIIRRTCSKYINPLTFLHTSHTYWCDSFWFFCDEFVL